MATKAKKETEAITEAAEAEVIAETSENDSNELEAKLAELEKQLAEAEAENAKLKAGPEKGGKADEPDEPEEKYAIVNIPLSDRDEKDSEFVGVNGNTYQIKKGEDVRVPLFVAEVLANKKKMVRYTADFNRKNAPKD